MDEQVLSLLKANLQITNHIQDDYLNHLIETAKIRIRAEGVTLGNTTEDVQLVEMYAAYLYRRRVGNEQGYNTEAMNPQGMPYMLRYALNNRIFSEKMRAQS